MRPTRRALVGSLAALSFAAACGHAPGHTPEPFAAEIQAFEASDRAAPTPQNGVLFVGSSSIRFWTTLAQDFPGYPVINRGFGGSQIAHAIRYADRIVVPYHPRLVVMYAGTNDIAAGKSVDEVYADYFTFVGHVLGKLPQTRIAYIACAPNPARWAMVDQFRALNARIEAHTRTDPRLAFIDVFPHMLGPDGQPKPGIFRGDRLHMNAKGYELWTAIVAPVLARLYGPPTAAR